jgi:hypothetical protein
MGVKVLWDNIVVSELLNIGDITSARERIETTTHDADCQTFIPGRASLGDIELECYFDGSAQQQALLEAVNTRKIMSWQLVAPADLPPWVIRFRGFVAERKLKYPLKGEAATASLTVVPVDIPREIRAERAELTALKLTEEWKGSQLTPDFDSKTSEYALYLPNSTPAQLVLKPTAKSGESVVVNGTVAAHNGTVELDNVAPNTPLFVVVSPKDEKTSTAVYTIRVLAGGA